MSVLDTLGSAAVAGAVQAAANNGGGITGMATGIVNGVTNVGTGIVNSVTGGLNPILSRLGISGLPIGGAFSPTGISKVGFQVGSKTTVNPVNDWRVRVSLAANSHIFYNDIDNTLMQPLIETAGVIFPYTPTVTVTHLASYTSQSLTHSNYTPQFYQNSDVSDITISGEFTVQNLDEGQYLMAVIYFFRSARMMFFGEDSKNQGYSGNPPPMLFLDGYGYHYLPHVPCILTSFSHTMPPDVDYVPVIVDGLEDRLPTSSTISITLKPQYSRMNIHNNFGLSDFAAGKLLGADGMGGFI